MTIFSVKLKIVVIIFYDQRVGFIYNNDFIILLLLNLEIHFYGVVISIFASTGAGSAKTQYYTNHPQ